MTRRLQLALWFSALMAAGCCDRNPMKPVPLTDQNRGYVALADAAVGERLRLMNDYRAKHPPKSPPGREFGLGDFSREMSIGCRRGDGWCDAERPVLDVRYTSTRRLASLGTVTFFITVYMDTNELTLNGSASDVLE